MEFIFVEQPTPEGPGPAVARAAEVLDDCDTLLLLADTIVDGVEELPPDAVGVAPVTCAQEFCVVTTAPDGTVTGYQDKSSMTDAHPLALAGIYRFADGAWLRKVLADDTVFAREDISEVLSRYDRHIPLRAVTVKGWRDLGSYDRYVKAARAALSGRSTHTFEARRDGGVLKRGETSLIDAQLDWYDRLPESAAGLTPRVLSAAAGNAYSIELCDYPTLARLLLYEQLGGPAWRFVLSELLETAEDVLWGPTRRLDSSLAGWCQRKYTAKTLRRLERWTPWHDLRTRPLRVNDGWVPAFDEVWPSAAAALDQLADTARESCFVHGDMTFSNILVARHYCVFKLIDPGTSFSQTQRGDVRYDLAKLRQSYAGGYDIYREDLYTLRRTGQDEVEIQRFPHRESLVALGDELINECGYELDNIRLLEAIQFLSMVPLHDDCPNRQLVLYLRGLRLLQRYLEGRQGEVDTW